MPNTVLKNLQENEEAGCFFVAEPSKDIKRGGGVGGDIKQWIYRSQKHLNLEAERASKSLTDLANGGHALVFHNSRYINEDIFLLANHPGSLGFICVPFRTSGDHEQTILSNFEKGNDNWREISATNTEINIYEKENGKRKRVNIHQAVHNWTTLFVQHATTKCETHGRHIINNDPKLTGSFTFDCIEAMSSGLAVGGRYDNTRFLKGEIASIELYHVEGKELPEAVQDLVIKNKLIASRDEEPPSKEKMKI